MTTTPNLATAVRLVLTASTSTYLTDMTPVFALVVLAAPTGMQVWILGTSVLRCEAAKAVGAARAAVPGGLVCKVVLITALELGRSEVSLVNL